jgi:hypothetical protein
MNWKDKRCFVRQWIERAFEFFMQMSGACFNGSLKDEVNMIPENFQKNQGKYRRFN